MVRLFYLFSVLILSAVSVISFFWTPILWSLLLIVPLFLVGVVDSLQVRRGIRRNYPIIGNLRYFFESIRPELQQYFVESDLSGRPIPREKRSVVYQRAKGDLQSVPFGSQIDMDKEGHEWILHSMNPTHVELDNLRVTIGGPQCKQPYSASILNVSAMSYGSISSAAVEALNEGAKLGGFYHNTGEGGISSYHKKGADLVWQIGTGYFGCRTHDGKFSSDLFQEQAALADVKMIELKISQGAKPGKGGMLPSAKVTKEIAEIRKVPVGKAVLSPSGHSEFNDPESLVDFIQKLRDLSGGKPVGIKMCLGKKSEFIDFCKAMVSKQIYPDFITVDGAEGGTGAAPLEFIDYIGSSINDGLAFVNDCLIGFGVRQHIKIIASGKVITGFDIMTKMALGADLINSARGMMLSLGCIHALKCNTNRCPAGIATNDPQLIRGLHVPTKTKRVAKYHQETINAFSDILGAMGYTHPKQVMRSDIFRRLSSGQSVSYEDLYPSLTPGQMLDTDGWNALPKTYQVELKRA